MIQLLPQPRQINQQTGNTTLPTNGYIVAPGSLFFEAQYLKERLDWPIVTMKATDAFVVQLAIDEGQPQGYHLNIGENTIQIEGSDAAGVFYGVCTLRQIIEQTDTTLPRISITDWPDYPARGVMLDISRDRVPTMDTLYNLIDLLASWKVNQFQLYTEHTFAYQDHRIVWEHASPLTAEEILALDRYCRERHIDLVPCQNSLGHMERWLKHERYHPLSECPDGFVTHWGEERGPSTVDPNDPGSITLVKSMFDELLPNFESELVNVGGDEPWELGQCKSKDAVEERGGRVYLDYMLKLYNHIKQHGRTVQFWGDIILHYPDLVPELPNDIIVMEWGYEAIHDFDGHGSLFAQSGIPFYVCPGTSSWNTIAGRTDNAVGNLQSAAVNGMKHDAIGYLNTDWGDNGHWQPLPVSYLGYAYGAAVSWAYEANRDIDLPAALDRLAFHDSAGVMGRLAYDLGNIYLMTGPKHINTQPLARFLLESKDKVLASIAALQERFPDDFNISPAKLRQIIERIDAIMAPLAQSRMDRADADLIRQEFTQAADLLRHGAKWLLWVQGESDNSTATLRHELDGLIARQRETWLARSRRGGLEDSMRRFDNLREAYRI